jgi:hypothetical protein
MFVKQTLTFITIVLLFTACKKSSGDNQPANNSIASITATLQAGKGIWQVPTDVFTYYDSNNIKVYTITQANIGYWTFTVADQGKIEYGSDPIHNDTYDFPYTLTTENGLNYLSINNIYNNPSLNKYQISTITNTSVTLTTTNVSLSYYDGTKGYNVTADHAVDVLTLIKYQ